MIISYFFSKCEKIDYLINQNICIRLLLILIKFHTLLSWVLHENRCLVFTIIRTWSKIFQWSCSKLYFHHVNPLDEDAWYQVALVKFVIKTRISWKFSFPYFRFPLRLVSRLISCRIPDKENNSSFQFSTFNTSFIQDEYKSKRLTLFILRSEFIIRLYIACCVVNVSIVSTKTLEFLN